MSSRVGSIAVFALVLGACTRAETPRRAAPPVQGTPAAQASGSAGDKTAAGGSASRVSVVVTEKGFEPAVQKLFAHTINRIKAGLMTPTVCLSYGGELAEMRALPGFDDLRAACAAHNVELFESVMSLTGMVNVGKGALVVGFASEPHAFAP